MRVPSAAARSRARSGASLTSWMAGVAVAHHDVLGEETCMVGGVFRGVFFIQLSSGYDRMARIRVVTEWNDPSPGI